MGSSNPTFNSCAVSACVERLYLFLKISLFIFIFTKVRHGSMVRLTYMHWECSYIITSSCTIIRNYMHIAQNWLCGPELYIYIHILTKTVYTVKSCNAHTPTDTITSISTSTTYTCIATHTNVHKYCKIMYQNL